MAPSSQQSSTFLHPASGALILGLDWLLFSGSIATLGLSTPSSVVGGFVVGGLGTGWLQYTYANEGIGTSIAKGVLGGLTVGIPLPVAGTAVGGAVLALSGLRRFWSSSDSASGSGDSNRLDE